MKLQFKKAERKGVYARIALDGPTGSGKTYSALAVAQGLANGKRICLIDTECESSRLYAGDFDFDRLDLDSRSPDSYIEALALVDPAVYGVVIVDSLSHAWMGKDGALEQVDRAAARSSSGNKFAAWRDVTPQHNRLVDALRSVPAHLIVTMRSKMEYVLEENERGQKVPRKIGLAPIQRDGIEYEFDIVGDMNLDNVLCISKTRASFLNQAVIKKPGADFGKKILEWCGHVEPTVTGDMLLAFGKGRSTTEIDEIKAKAQEKYGKGIRELTIPEFEEFTASFKEVA